MEQIEERFYVKNLPPNVTDDDFKSFFGNIGDIHDIVIKNNYAFFSAKGSHRALKKASFTFAKKLWNGHEIKLEKAAKESFMTRLAKEREALGTKKNGFASDPAETVDVKTKRKYSSSDDSDDENMKAGVPKFRGTLGLYPEEKQSKDVMTTFSEFDSMWADDDGPQQNSEQLSAILGSGKSKKVSKTFDEKIKPLSKMEKKKRDDERRKLSLANKSKEKQKQMNLIKSALSSVNLPKAKKIIFDSDDEGKPNEKQSLFDDADENCDNFVIQEKEQFQGEKGQKLLMLQSQFNNDDRFKLDNRFLEDDDKQDEKKTKDLQMIRFDPTKPSGEEDETTVPLKLSKKSQKITPANNISKERFYEVSENLSAAFKENSSGFSLLTAYSRRNLDEDVNIEEVKEVKMKPIKKRNPLVRDSSDDEYSEGDAREDSKIWAPVVNVPSGSRDNFFFAKNDPLISEAMEFMNMKNSEEARMVAENYDQTRRNLKKIFRDQAMRRNKKTDMFRKKVGGMKKKVVKKKNPFMKSNAVRKKNMKR